MIKLYIFSLLAIVLALLVSLYLGFPGDPGYLLIAFGSYTFETSLFALMVAVGIIYLFVKLLLLVFHWINPWQLVRYGRLYSSQRKARARSDTVEGLLYFTRGNWESSYNLLIKSVNDTDASVVNYLAAAYAAYQRGDRESWVQCLEKAEIEYPTTRSTINSLKAQLLFKSEQLEQCVAVLQKMKSNSLNDSSLLQLLKEVYLKLRDWQQLENLLPVLEKNKIIGAEELERIRVRIFMETLYAAGRTGEASGKNQDAANQITKLWKKAPLRYKEDERVVRHYSEILLGLSLGEEAAKAIEVALTKAWSDGLISRYGEMDFGHSQQRLLQAENWLKARPANAKLLLALGRLSRRNELWGKAREYYEASIKIEPTAAAYGELSRLLRHMGEEKPSAANHEKFVAMIGVELSDLPLPDSQKNKH